MTAPGKYSFNKPQAGLSLIELMVALALGVVITFAAVNLFLQSKVSYLQDEESARLQENGRYAMRLLARELSMAGFLGAVLRGDLISESLGGAGCFSYMVDTEFPFEHHNNVTADGVSALNDPNMPSDCLSAGNHVAGTDILVVRRSLDAPHVLDGNAPTADVEDNAHYIRVEDYNVSITIVEGASADYSGKPVNLWEYNPKILFLYVNDGIPSLCRRRLSTTTSNTVVDTECLVEGVENLQVEFGLDENGDLQANRFDPQPTSAELGNAVVARVYLLMRSVNEVSGYTNDKTYTLGQTTVAAANDGYYRRVFQTTVLLRNSEAFKF